MSRSSLVGTVYLLHFDKPYRHAQHYIGWTVDLDTRLAMHRNGHGARLLEVVQLAGITWQVARTWPNVSRNRERQLKNQGGASRRCPMCGVRPRKEAPRTLSKAEQIARRFWELADEWDKASGTERDRINVEIDALSAFDYGATVANPWLTNAVKGPYA